MTPDEHGPLDEVAGAVADGTPVDWARERTQTPPDLHRALDHLSVVERIKAVHAGAPVAIEVTRTAPVPVSPPPIQQWGHLRVLELLGYGTWGEVYRAFDPTLQREVALKLLKLDGSSEAHAEAFLAEARRLARVRHPNVVLVHGADRHDGRYGIWTELIQGQTLEAYQKSQGPLGWREAAGIGIDLCAALSAVHRAGLIHRDIKASNVMRERGGRIVLMDFGSGVEVPAGGDVRASRHIHGTPLVMAPEQLRGEVAGAATDVYGVGALLYWLVSGTRPIDAESFEEIVRSHDRKAYIPLRDRRPNLPRGFVEVVERAIAPDPHARYASAGALERALAAYARPPAGRRRWVEAAVAAVAVVTVATLTRASCGKREHPENTAARVVPAPPVPRAALTATASLQRLTPRGDEAIASGSRIRPGDQLSMTLRGSDSMYAYVLDKDRTGDVFVLFPIPGLEPANPIAPAVEHHLPGSMGDRRIYWKVTSSGGTDSIITIASRAPLEAWERLIRRFPRAQRGRSVQPNRVSSEAIGTLRGIGGLAEEPPSHAAAVRSLGDALHELEERRARTGDVWIWTTELSNPSP